MLHAQNTAKPRFCPTPIAHLHGPDGHFHIVPCKREPCPVCGRRRRASFIRRASQCTYLARMLTVSLPDHGEPSLERLRYFNRRCAVLKQYLDRQYGKQPPPVWCDERGDGDHLHGHRLLGDYGYIDLPSVRKWMLKNGLCDLAQDGRLVPWYIKYELLRHQEQAVKYVAAYVAKSATTTWPKYARTRYVPVPEPKREPASCGPHAFFFNCDHLLGNRHALVGNRPLNLDDRVAIAEAARVDCFDCLAVIRSALASPRYRQSRERIFPLAPMNKDGGGHGPVTCEAYIAPLTASFSSMFSYIATHHRVLLLSDKIGKEAVK